MSPQKSGGTFCARIYLFLLKLCLPHYLRNRSMEGVAIMKSGVGELVRLNVQSRLAFVFDNQNKACYGQREHDGVEVGDPRGIISQPMTCEPPKQLSA